MTAEYTGPTAIREVEGKIHIDGYPTAARYVALDTPLAKRLADLRMHQNALRLCEEAMQEFGQLTDPSSTVGRIVLIGVVASYFSCFGQNEASLSLSADKVFKGSADAREAYNFWKLLRNKHVIHNESGYCTMITGVVLDSKAEVQDILSTQLTADMTRDHGALQNLYNLITHTQKFVEKEVDALLPRIFEQVALMPPEKRSALPDVKWVVPGVEDLAKTRQASWLTKA